MSRDLFLKENIGGENAPFIVAEISGNHCQSFEKAIALIDAAAQAGASAVKFQTYTADTMTLNSQKEIFMVKNSGTPWEGESLYNLYQKSSTPWSWHKDLFEHAKEVGLVPFSSPFDTTAVDFLETIGTPCYKIASFENIDLPLIKYVAQTHKPIILSTGMASLSQIDNAVRIIKDNGGEDIVLLKCTSTYPANPSDSNLKTLVSMRQAFGCEVGLSDHTLGFGVAVASVALGATVVEKHITLSKNDGSVDGEFSLLPNEFKVLVNEIKCAWKALGKVKYGPNDDDIKSTKYRRSLFIVKDLKKGDVLTNENIRVLRPGHGLPPEFLEIVVGMEVKKNATSGTPLDWSLVKIV